MKHLKTLIPMLGTYAQAPVRNAEHFPAWTPGDAQRLEQLAMTGTLGQSFYASQTELSRDAVALLERADAADLARAIILGRNTGFMRAFPLLGLVWLSRKDTELFRETFPQVVLTGNDLGDFIDLARRTRGLGRAIKSAIHAWIAAKVTPYYAMKYRRNIADAIRVSRFRGEDPIYAYILQAYSEVKGISQEKLEAAYAAYPELAAQRRFLELLHEKRTEEAAEILREHRLDSDSLTAFANLFDTSVWEAVAENAPVMKFLKYLDKFAREGVEIDAVARKKITVENLRRAKVFPFRLYTAILALKGRPAVAETLLRVLDEYAATFDWSLFNRKSWVIAPDVSGSMFSPMGRSSVLTFAHLSAMFTAFFLKGLDRVHVLPWDTEVQLYLEPRTSPVMEHIDNILRRVGGGTHMEAALEYMLKHRINADYSVFLTDTEEYGKGWLATWKRYRAQYPAAQAFLLRADSYQTAPISEEDAKKYGVRQIFGWNDSAIDFMQSVIEADCKMK